METVLRRLRQVPRRRLLVGVLVVAVLGGVAVFALGARPDAEASFPVGVEAAHVGTTYAFDGVLCLGSSVAGSQVADVEVEQAPGSTTRLARPVDGPPTLGIPVDPEGAEPAEGYDVPAGEQDCDLRLLVTADREGQLEAGRIRLRLSYGPGGLLRRTFTLEPPVTLDATQTGPDTRAGG
jgi:hypothetical protein